MICPNCRKYPCICEKKPYNITCDRCFLRGDTNREPHVVVTPNGDRIWKETFESYRFDKYPIRCRRCERVNKSRTRMKRTLAKLAPLCLALAPADKPWDKYAKMVTAPLPSEPLTVKEECLHYEDVYNSQLLQLRKYWKKFRRYYKNLMKGGTYVVEVTHKVNFDRDKGPWFATKFHFHIHAVVAMPYLSSKNGSLQAFSNSGPKFGLGLVHVRGKPYGIPPWEYSKHLGNYICKYFTKQTWRASPFGMLIGYVPPDTEHATENSTISVDS